MASVGEGDCHKDPNFAVICSFFDKYSASLGLPEVSYTELQKYLEDTSTDVSNVLIDIHVKLLRRIGKSTVTPERFEKNIIKFIHHYSQFDAWEVESYGYKHAKLDTKLRILKNLLECQFDYNVKFKEKVNESSAEDMRFLPIGRDKEGQAYWYFLDKDMNLLVYKEEQDDDAANTWQLVCSDRQDLAKLVNALQNGAHNQNQDKDKPSPTDSQSSKEENSHDKEGDKKEVAVKVEENGCVESNIGERKERFMEIKIHKCDLVEPTKVENQEPKTGSLVVVKKEVDEAEGLGTSPSKAKKSSTTADKTKTIVDKDISHITVKKSCKKGEEECNSTGPAKDKAIELNQKVESIEATEVNCIDNKLDNISEITDQTSLADKVILGTLNQIDLLSSDTMSQNLNISSNNSEKIDSISLTTTCIKSQKECQDSLQSLEAEKQNDARNSEMTDLSKTSDDSKPAPTSKPDSPQNTTEKMDLQMINEKESIMNKDIGTFTETSEKDSGTVISEDDVTSKTSVAESEITGNSATEGGSQTLSEKQSGAESNKKSESELHEDVGNSLSAPASEGLPAEVTQFSHTTKEPPDKPGIAEDIISNNKESGRVSDEKSLTVNLADDSNQSACSLGKAELGGSDQEKFFTEVTNTENKTIEDGNKSMEDLDQRVEEKKTSTASEIKSDTASDAKEIISIDPHISVKTNESLTTQKMKPEDVPGADEDKSTDALGLKENKDSSVATEIMSVHDLPPSSVEVDKSGESATNEDNSSVDTETKDTNNHVKSSILAKTSLDVTTSCSDEKSDKGSGIEQNNTGTSLVDEKMSISEESVETFVDVIEPLKSPPTKENKAVENLTDKDNNTETYPANENKCTENLTAEDKKSNETLTVEEHRSEEEKITEDNKSIENPIAKDKRSLETTFTEETESPIESTKSTETPTTEDTKSTDTPIEDKKSTETLSSEDKESTETPSTKDTQSTKTLTTEDTKSTETPSTEDTKSTETPSTEGNKSTDIPSTEDTKSTETPSTEDTNTTETPSTEGTKSTDIPSTEDTKSTETPSTEDKESTETPSTKDTQSTKTLTTKDTKSTETPSTEDTKSTETPSTEGTKSTDIPSTEDTKSTETPSTEDTKSSESPSTEGIQSTDIPSTEDTKSTETPSTEDTNTTETPSTEGTKSTDIPSTEDTKSTETPSTEDKKSSEYPSTEGMQSTDIPSTKDTKSTETPSTEDTKSTEIPSTEGIKPFETSAGEDTKPTENPSTEDTKSTNTSSNEDTRFNEPTAPEENKSLETPATEENKCMKISTTRDTPLKTPTTEVKKSTETLTIEDNTSLETPFTEGNKSFNPSTTGDEKSTKPPVNEENDCNEAHITETNASSISGKKKSKKTSKKEQSKILKTTSAKEDDTVNTTVSEKKQSLSENNDTETSGRNESNTADGKETIVIGNITDAISNSTVIEMEVVSNDDSGKVNDSCNEQSTIQTNAAEEISTEKTGRKRPCRSKSGNRKTTTNAAKGSKKSESPLTTETANSEPHRNLKRSAPEPGSDEPVDSKPNGKRAKQAAKAQKSRRGRNAAARGRAARMANCETESEDSETPLSQIRSRRQMKAAASKEGSGKVSSDQGNKKGSEPDGEENITNGKRAKKKKPGSSSEPVTEEEVTPAKKGRNFTQTSASNKKTSTSNKAAKKVSPKPPATNQNEEEEGAGVRRSLRVRQLKAKRPPTPSSQSEGSEGGEDTEEDKKDQDFFDSSFTPEEESGDEEFKPKGRNFQRQAARTGHVNDEEVVNDDTPCVKCGKYNHPEMILLCDKCDAGYHTACLRPPLMLIPDGDWFCPPCEHLMLITKLLECLQTLDNATKKKDRLHKRQERLAFVGINISNILHGDRKSYISGKTIEDDKECQENNESDAKDDSGSSESSESESPKRTFRSERLALRQAQKRSRHEKHKQRRATRKDSPEGEVLTKRTCRLRNAVSYQFKEFDELISNAIEDDKPCRREKPPGIRRGKDMSNILGASDEEDEKIRLRDGDSGGPPPVVKKRTKRKLTKLDSDEDPDEDDESEEFRLSEEENSSDASEAEEEDEDASTSNLDSGDWKPKKTWYNSHSPSHRPKRKAKSFVIDDDEYESEENSSKRRSTRNSNRGRIHYNVWDSEDDETEEEQSTSDFCSEDSESFSSRKKKTKAALGKNKSGAKAKKADESDDHSDSSIARRRKLLRKLVKKRRKDTSDSQDTEIESQSKKEKSSKKKKSSSEDTECSATEESEGTDESPKFKKKNVLRSSDEETETEAEKPSDKPGCDQIEKPAAAETKQEIAKDVTAQEAPIRTEEKEKPEVVTKSKPRMGPKCKQLKGKKRTENQEPGDNSNVVPSDVPDKVRKVSDQEVECTEELKSPPAGAKRKPPARRQRGKSKEGPFEAAQPEKSSHLPGLENVPVESQRPVTKKKKVPNFLDVPSGGEESDDQKSNKPLKLSLDNVEKEMAKQESTPAAQSQAEAPANYGNFPGQQGHPHHMQYPPNPANYHLSHTSEDMSSYPQDLPTAHAGHPPHSRQLTAPSGQPPNFDHPRFPQPHGGMSSIHQAGSVMRNPHPSYPAGANPPYQYQSNMSQGYQNQEPGEVLSQGHKTGAHSNFPGGPQHTKPPPGHIHGVMPQNANFHMGQQKEPAGGYIQNYGPNRMPLPQEMVPQGRRDLGPGCVRDMGPGQVREIGPGSLREMAPGHIREMGPGNVREMGPRHIREMGPRHMGHGNPREMVPGHQREMGPGHPRDMGPGHPREMGPGHPREMGPGHPREISPGHPREMGPGHPREISPGHPKEMGPGHPRDIGPGNAREMGHGHPREMGPGHPKEMGPGHPREMGPVHSKELGPGHPREMGPGNAREMGPGHPREMGPGHPREMGPGHPREMGPGHPREMGPGHPREMGLGHPREMGPGHPKEMGPGHPREMGPGHPKEMGPGHPREMGPGHPREMGPGHPREMGSGHPREMGPSNAREMGPGNMQHPYYGMQPPFHNMHQHYPPHYQGGMPGHPMSSPLNSMGQMTKNLGHEQGMSASTFSNVPCTDGTKEHQKLVSPHRQDSDHYTPEKGEMSKLKNVEVKEGKRSKASNKSKPKSKSTIPQADVSDQPVSASKMSKMSMGEQDIGHEKDLPKSVPSGDPSRNPHPGLVGYKSPDQAYGSSGHMSYPIPYAAHSQQQSMPMAHMPPKHSTFLPPTAHMSSHHPTSGSSAFKTEPGHTEVDVKPIIADSKGEISKQNLSPTEQRANIAYPNVPSMNPAKVSNEPPPSHQSQTNPPAMSYPQRFSGPSNVQGPNQMSAHGGYYHGPYYHSYGPPPGQAMHPPNTWPQNMPSYRPRMGSPNMYPYGMHPEAMNQGYNMMPKNAPQSTKEAAASNAIHTPANPDTMNTQFSKSIRRSGSVNEEDHPPNVTDKSEGQKSQSLSSKDLSDGTKTINEGELPKDAAIDAQQKTPQATPHLPHRPQPTHSGSSSQSSDAPSQSVPESSPANVTSGTKQSVHSTIPVSSAPANSWPDPVQYHQHRGGPWPGMNDPGQFRMMQPYANQGMMGAAHYPPKFQQQQPAHTNPPPEQRSGHADGRPMGGPGPYFQPGYHGFEPGFQPANCGPQLQGQDYSRGPPRPDFNSKQSYKPPAQEDSLNLSADQSQSGDDQSVEANAASKPKRAKTQKKSAKEGGPSGRVRSAKGRGRGRGGFMIDNLLQARGMEGEEEGDDSGEMKDIVSYVTTDDYFKQQTSS